MDILVMFSIGAVVVAVVMRLHFRREPDVRVALVSPPVFAIIGALLGITVGMIWFPDSQGRIFLENGVKHAVLGMMVGGLVGSGARELCAKLVRTRIIAVVLTLMLLGVSVCAPFGWIYGNAGLYEDVHEADQLTRRAMLWGSAIGCFVGLMLGLLEACFGGRRPKLEVGACENAVL